jgi:N-methylhydantoinase B
LFGGHPGAGNEVAVKVGDKEIQFPSGKVLGRQLKPNDAYVLRSGGGGGFGSPLDRPLRSIERDLHEGYITPERAEGCYGIVFAEDRSIDPDATARERDKRRAEGRDLPPAMSPADISVGETDIPLGLSPSSFRFSIRCSCCTPVLEFSAS